MTKKATYAAWLCVLGAISCGGTEPANDPSTDATATATSTAPAETSTTATTSTAPTATATTPPAPEPKLDLDAAVKKYVTDTSAAWSTVDPKKHIAVYAPDGVVAMIGERGIEEAKAPDYEKSLAGYFAAFPDSKLTYTRVVAKGNLAVAEWVYTGTNKGDFMGKKATNKKVGYRGATIVTFAPDGKVKRETVYFAFETLMGQLGFGQKGQKVRPVEAEPKTPTEIIVAKEGDPSSDAMARKWFDNTSKGDVKGLTDMAADDYVASMQYMAADSKGKKALEKEATESNKAFADQKTTVAVCVPAGDYVACEYQWTATWKGPAMGMQPTGKTGTVHGLDVIKVKDGKVTHVTGYANGLEFATAFGLAQPKEAGKPADASAKKEAGGPAPKDGGKAPPPKAPDAPKKP